MKKFKNPVSILLVVTIILSLFTVIPVVSAADEISLQWIFEAAMKAGGVDHDIKLLVDVKGNGGVLDGKRKI